MNNEKVRSNFAGTATAILLSFLLFYFPSVLAIYGHDDEPGIWTIFSIVMATLYTLIFCVNYFWIVPYSFFRSNKKVMFFILNAVIVTAACGLVPLWFETHGGLPRPRHLENLSLSIGQYLMGYLRFVVRDGIMMVLSIALAYALRLAQDRENMRRKRLELEAEQRRIELKSLKAQLNPHFLFNSLNNIYALIAISPERAQKALHDLSGMLRFMIYDAANSFVPLQKEMQFISDYVELMKLRLSSGIRLDCAITTSGSEGLTIAPLLFLTLVENAFKHVADNGNGAFISIAISTDEDSVICRVENSCGDTATRPSMSNGESGVGLTNVERQLRLIYPGVHSLTLKKEGGIFHARITIAKTAMTVSARGTQKPNQ
ncbi:sensor histidine kinase [Lepagella muris]|jgi:hypothetical protein|uniref:Sensor histidine kinase n=1 Tax=Lepagella muris TaxID=3032870 RepID=A0AC61RES2_9BACT|nr:sensor histidine kinase [Lepagella muris]TGY79129.1 sensor histidine kinase [Lepagella muris]THG46793.1 GHKL domain-containing protein [Bacteroidales bacterium]TKC59444.1 GHKL domain-containing protein [Bacteroidales bacterium]